MHAIIGVEDGNVAIYSSCFCKFESVEGTVYVVNIQRKL